MVKIVVVAMTVDGELNRVDQHCHTPQVYLDPTTAMMVILLSAIQTLS